MRVTTGSRLHAGFYHISTLYNVWSVLFAGAGFYVEYPRVVVEARRCDRVELEGFGDLTGAVKGLLLLAGFTACLRLSESMPRHSGLGSTTQILLASLLAASRASGFSLSIDSLIELSGRASRYSSIGSLLFKYGGFVVEPGVPAKNGLYRPLVRLDVPGDWRFVIALPRAERGLDETREKYVMDVVLFKSVSTEARLLMSVGCLRLASGIARRDLEDALAGLAMMQRGTGMVFETVQGGVYREDLQHFVEIADRRGVKLAQSSWGPTLYTIATSSRAPSVKESLEKAMEKAGLEGEVLIAAPRNSGASLEAASRSPASSSR
ncbi:MAG: hypothetical protein QXS85_04255 [Acidilobaceae archaeon]